MTELGGARSPDHSNSQKNFRAAIIMFSDAPLTAPEMTYFHLYSLYFSGLNPELNSNHPPFEQATGGGATMSTLLSDVVIAPTSTPDPNSTPTPRKQYFLNLPVVLLNPSTTSSEHCTPSPLGESDNINDALTICSVRRS